MKMFIPEIGSRIVLIEDFEFSICEKYDIIEAGVILSIKKISIKMGQSHNNHIEFNVLKCKENKKSKFYGDKIRVSIMDVNDMNFDLIDCNEETKNSMINVLSDIRTKTGGVNDGYRKIESVLLDGKNILAFYPTKSPIVFFKEILLKIKNVERYYSKIMTYDELYAIINKNFRKTKIAIMLE